MNNLDAYECLEYLTTAFPYAYRTAKPKKVVEIWEKQFKEYSKDEVITAIDETISVCEYPPSIAKIKSFLPEQKGTSLEQMYRNKAKECCPNGFKLIGVFGNIPATDTDIELIENKRFMYLARDNVSCKLYCDGKFGDIHTVDEIIKYREEHYPEQSNG